MKVGEILNEEAIKELFQENYFDEIVARAAEKEIEIDGGDDLSRFIEPGKWDDYLDYRFEVPDIHPADMRDFSCHECGGEYGPWEHERFFIHGYDNINVGHARYRFCTECDHDHFNSYSIGYVDPSDFLVVDMAIDMRSGLIRIN